MEAHQRVPIGNWFGTLWMAATALSVASGVLLASRAAYFLGFVALPFAWALTLLESLGVPVSRLYGEDFIPLMYMASAVVCISLATGLTQQLILRRYLPRVRWWWAATVAGSYLGALLSFVYWTIVSPEWLAGGSGPAGWSTRLLAFALGGLVVGGGQWLVLRRLVLRAGRWVVASALGWGLGLPLAQSMLDLLSYGAEPRPTTIALSGLALGGAAGLVTGVTLTWLLRAPLWRTARYALALAAMAVLLVYGRIQSESGQANAVVIEYAIATGEASLAWSPDSQRLALSGDAGTVRIWDRSGKELLLPELGHTAPIAWSRDGRWIAASLVGETKVYDAVTGQEHHNLINAPRRSFLTVPTWSPDGKYLAIGTRDGIELWNAATWAREEVVRPDSEWVYLDVRWSPDGKRMAIFVAKAEVLVWEPAPAKPALRSMGRAFDLSWGTDGNLLALAVPGAARVTRLVDPPETVQVLDLGIPDNIAYGITWSPDGKHLAVDLSKQIRVWNTAIWAEEVRLDAQTFAGGAPTVWSPDGRRLAYPVGHTVHVWDTSTKRVHVLRGHKGGLLNLAWSPDSLYLASASEDGTVRIWAVR